MINNNNIENNLHHWMQQEPSFNEDLAWADMKEKLQPKKKRRFFFWWFVFAGIVLAGAGYGIYKYQQSNTQKSLNISTENTQEKLVSKEEETKNETTEANNGLIKNETSIESNVKNNIEAKDAKENEISGDKKDVVENSDLKKAEPKSNAFEARKEEIIKGKQEKINSKLESSASVNLEFKSDKKNIAGSKKVITNNASNTKKQALNLNEKKPEVYAKKEVKQRSKKANGIEKLSSRVVKSQAKTKDVNNKEFEKEIVKKEELKPTETKKVDKETLNATAKTTVDISKKDSTNKADSIAKKNTASETPKPTAKKEEVKKKIDIDFGAGLDWHLPIPLNKGEYFYAGKDLKPNAFNYLIPSVYTNITLNKKHSLFVGFTPFAQYNLPQQATYDVVSGSWKDIDSRVGAMVKNYQSWALTDTLGNPLQDSFGYVINEKISVTKQSKVGKAFGYGFYGDYYYNINDKWQVGVGAIYNSVTSYFNFSSVKRTDTTNFNEPVLDIRDTALLNPNQSNGKINNSFLSGKISLLYNFKKLSVGLNATIPFDGINKEGEVNRNTIFNFLIRLKLIK